MAAITARQAESLARCIAEGRPDWDRFEVQTVLYGLLHNARVSWDVTAAAAILAAGDPANERPRSIADLKGRHWAVARDMVRADERGRRFADRHSRDVLTQARLDAAARVDPETHAVRMAALRRQALRDIHAQPVVEGETVPSG